MEKVLARTICANYCTDFAVHIEVHATTGQGLDITMPLGQAAELLDELTTAVDEAREHQGRAA